MPGPTGKGVRMRAHAVLEALAALHAVTCLVVPLWDPRGAHDVPAETSRIAEVVVAPPPAAYAVHRRLLAQAWYRRLAARAAARVAPWPLESIGIPATIGSRRLAGRRFRRVHAFRLCTAPFAAPFLVGARLSIDLDDLEGDKQRRIALLPATAPAVRRAFEADAVLSDLVLARWRARADVLLVASEQDRARLERAGGARILVAPNVVRAPAIAPPLPSASPHRILFVGGLDYAPNRDAVAWLVREIVPALARHDAPSWELHLVGTGGHSLLAELGVHDARVIAHDTVPDVTPHLARARAVVVPLRAGGGTRIKVLEALAHARPVVSTTLGAEGLELQGGRHLLIGDDAATIAGHLATLLRDGDLATRLGMAGRARVAAAYSPEALARALADL
ncbi:glycosyltransferase family 4 protein [Candidatus Binatia bacterium]|nr:glycosyltransferase family 4 protein [Candidatus Binatia bacterium]